MIDERFKIRVNKAFLMGGVEVFIYHEVNGKQSIVTDLVMKDVPPYHMVPPTAMLSSGNAQQLIDELWEAGLRPSEGTGSAGSLRATENHLDDMRKIAFKKLNIDNG